MTIVTASPNPVRATCTHDDTWRAVMKSAVRDPVQLCRMLELPTELDQAAVRAARDFPVFAPLPYIARIETGNPRDPLLRQVLPLEDEVQDVAGFTTDPVGDSTAKRAPGLLQKYHGRALMITSGACAVHCRYCFRRHYPYPEVPRSPQQWAPILKDIARETTIEEIILSGGDPLTLVDAKLAELVTMLAEIRHIRRIRVHSRLPIVIPQRVTDSLIAWLRGTRLSPIMVVHANHPREIDRDVVAALGRVVRSGIPVLNQAVLLRGVNDDPPTQVELSQRLLDCHVMPYYLHQLDRVAGAAHFEVPVAEGIRIVEQMRERLPGYAVPRFVQEVPGRLAKHVLA